MITVEEAIQIINSTKSDFGTEYIPLHQAVGKVLREPLLADRPFPPYNRVTMDGIAIRYDDFQKGTRQFSVKGIAPAGAPVHSLTAPDGCIETMTGAVLPEGTDSVIRYEDITIDQQIATIHLDSVVKGQNVHVKGQDRKEGEQVVPPGVLISPAEIGVASTIGKDKLLVSKMPRVMILSTGDELVEIHQTPQPHQIRRSNVYRLHTTLHLAGIEAHTFHLNDNYDEIVNALQQILLDYDIVLMSGGVSKGKFDYLPDALAALGVTKLFHKIMQRPGKPFWFGQSPKGTLIFALPGNPVSSFLCTHRYFLPWLKKTLGYPPERQPFAQLATDFTFKPDLTYFLQVKIDFDKDGITHAYPVEGNGSGDLANLVDADAFLQLPRGKDHFSKGEVFPCFTFRNF